jgi:ABC-type dipeptide/oligopeptide/nickel transport system permease subunit
MVYLGILFSIGIMVGVISVAFNKKSNFITRIASLIALALMVLTIIICLIVAFTDNTVVVDESVLIVGAPVEATKTGKDNTLILLLFIIFLVAFFVTVTVLALKEHKKINAKKQNSINSVW